MIKIAMKKVPEAVNAFLRLVKLELLLFVDLFIIFPNLAFKFPFPRPRPAPRLKPLKRD